MSAYPSSLLPTTKTGDQFVNITLGNVRGLRRSERAVEVMMTLAWSLGPQAAFAHYTKYILGGDMELPVSWLIESRSFAGTLYADVFALMCGEEMVITHMHPTGWEYVG